MIERSLRETKIAGIAQVLKLIREQEGGLLSIGKDEGKSKQLIQYLEALSENLQEQQTTILAEASSLSTNVDHIKHVIQMQQEFAHSASMLEPAGIREEIEDALRLNEASFSRHGIEIVREYTKVPRMMVDRHRMIQILVNLIGNARHALKDSDRPDKKIILRAGILEGQLQIDVVDNGIGIPAENLDKLFTFGFTTRKKGHGFGLHSSANAIREMGGTMGAKSEGPGKGATFTLRIPVLPIDK
jgi:two-component system, LuxR family, sensor kinase FixL